MLIRFGLVFDLALDGFIEFFNAFFTSESESDREKILALFLAVFFRNASSELDGGVGRDLLGSRDHLGTLMLPLGFFLAFMNAPTSGFPVAVGWWMVAISCMIFAMSGVLAATNWEKNFI